ncbi:YopX family protein [Streptococcus uberis]|nr:YopX family protein [Streptococcus uberis]
MIKFRAWDKKLEMMIDVVSIDFIEKTLIGEHWEYGYTVPISFSDAILMQSTGLFDENGVEVFEGDILYYPEQDEDNYGYIEFDKDRLAFVLDNGFEKFVYGEYGMSYIVGNIYENPELLESVEE